MHLENFCCFFLGIWWRALCVPRSLASESPKNMGRAEKPYSHWESEYLNPPSGKMWMDECMDEWINGSMDERMNGWIEDDRSIEAHKVKFSRKKE